MNHAKKKTRWTCFIRVSGVANRANQLQFTGLQYKTTYSRSLAQLENIIPPTRLLLFPLAFRYGQSHALYSKCSCPQPERCGRVPDTDSSPSPRVCPRIPVGQCIHLQVRNCPTIKETKFTVVAHESDMSQRSIATKCTCETILLRH